MSSRLVLAFLFAVGCLLTFSSRGSAEAAELQSGPALTYGRQPDPDDCRISPELSARLRHASERRHAERIAASLDVGSPLGRVTGPTLMQWDGVTPRFESKPPRPMARFATPLRFIDNRGQVDATAKFYLTMGSQTLWLTSEGILFDFARVRRDATRVGAETTPGGLHPKHPFFEQLTGERERLVFAQDLVGAKRPLKIEARSPQPGTSNYFSGNDPAQWRTGVRSYAEVIYREVWDGVDLRLYGKGSPLEQEFIVRPGADPGQIRIAYRGIDRLRIAQDGSLRIDTAFGELQESPPKIYQVVDGERVEVTGRFKLLSEASYTFDFGPYSRQYALVIDPTLVYSTFFGGADSESFPSGLVDIGVDPQGHAYVAGTTRSPDFPATLGIFAEPRGSTGVFVTKLNPTGTRIIYSTLIDGNDIDVGLGIAVDSASNAYLAGYTHSTNFPTTPGAFQRASAGISAFVAKLDSTGTALLYSTYLGGNDVDIAFAIAVDGLGHASLTGLTHSRDFPVTPGAAQPGIGGGGGSGFGFGGRDAFVSKLSPTGAGLVYSTYLGGFRDEVGFGIAVDQAGSTWVVGSTTSPDFPITPGAIQPTWGGGFGGNRFFADGFATKLDPDGTALAYSTYIGRGGDAGGAGGVAVDQAGNAYVTGSGGGLLSGPGAVCPSCSGGPYVAKLEATGALVYFEYLRSGGADSGLGVAVDAGGNAYVTGFTTNPNFLTVNPVQGTLKGGSDAFVAKLNPSGNALIYSTYLGGGSWDVGTRIRLDGSGKAYVAGLTGSPDFPVTPVGVQTVYGGGDSDIFVVKIADIVPVGISLSGIQPRSGGDTGDVTVAVAGTGFMPGATVKLARAGHPDIQGTLVTVGESGTLLATTFDLRGKDHGLWDLVVVGPDGGSASLVAAFAIEEGRVPQIWVDVVGREAIRVGDEQIYYVIIGNRGNVDVLGVPLFIFGIPSDATWQLGFNLARPRVSSPGMPIDWSTVPVHIDTDEGIVLPVLIPRLSPGSSSVLSVRIMANSPNPFVLRVRAGIAHATNPAARIGASAVTPLAISPIVGGLRSLADLICTDPSSCVQNLLRLPPGADCALAVFCALMESLESQGNFILEGAAVPVWDIVSSWLEALLECAQEVLPVSQMTSMAIELAHLTISIVTDCSAAALDVEFPVRSVAARDPNDKAGAVGFGTSRYISGEEPLRYAVYFENVASATAAAREVVLSDQLDSRNLDLGTFSFGPVSFGDRTIFPPAKATEFVREIDLRPSQNLGVRVAAQFDSATGLVTWRLTSIDPATGGPPEDPLAGFLPPNRMPPEGQGSVLFIVMPKMGLPSGTTIRNEAAIVFDANDAIVTPQWLNTIDNLKPASRVSPLSAQQSSMTFTVQWSGTDGGAGVRDYTIFVSENGGPFTVFQRNTTATSAPFTGRRGSTYGFVSTARDQAGNIEGTKTTVDASTHVLADDLPPTTKVIAAPEPNENGWNNTAVTVNLSAEDEAGGAGVKEIIFSLTGAQTGEGTVAGSSATVGISAEGTTTLTYFARDNAGNDEARKSVTARIDKTPPVLSGLPRLNCTLWPPNHRLVHVAAVTADDLLSGIAPGSFVVSGSSNEPENGLGDGDVAPDIVIDGGTVQLRAERSGTGPGRNYTLNATASDLAGNTVTATATCAVPHDRR